jgi:hypothetical protein
MSEKGKDTYQRKKTREALKQYNIIYVSHTMIYTNKFILQNMLNE